MMQQQLTVQITRYFRAVYGDDYVYRAPETFDNVLERWMLAVADNDLEAAERHMATIEELARR